MTTFPTNCPFADKLDHDLYEQRRSLVQSSPVWPDDRKVASFILIRLQRLELDPPEKAIRDPRWNTEFGTFSPPYRAHSLIEYGNRIGIFRLLDFLQPLGWRIAVSVNGIIAQQNPGLLSELASRDVEILASGWSASRMISNALDEATERVWTTNSINATSQVLGAMPRAYASQDYGYSCRSADILTELGVKTTIDWPNDEKPIFFGSKRALVNLPVLSELEDSQMVINRKLQTTSWVRQLRTAFEQWPQSAVAGSVMILPLHAWICAVPHRFTQFRKLMLTQDPHQFWQAYPTEIDRRWRLTHQILD